jgi:radical SAM superfamily enzyme YgiQ (UPF0313 family)
MGLALLAAYTPDEHEVEIVDEGVCEVDLNADVDLVGLTFMTPQAPRAYELAGAFRERGIPVVFGGVHCSTLPEEAAEHADSVVIGEADDIWTTVLSDARANRLKRFYKGGLVEPDQIGAARRDLLGRGYVMPSVQTARGCPFNCSFCSVTLFNGGKYRARPVADVVREIESLDSGFLLIVDDNIIGSGSKSVRRAAELFDALQGSGKLWGSQTSINVGDDPALLRRAAAAGARWFFIGFESIDAAALRVLDKPINLRALSRGYAETIKRIQDAGIGVIGSFMFGSDSDSPDVFERTYEFIQQTRLDGVQLAITTPFPGTRLFKQIEDEGRLFRRNFPDDWRHYSAFEPVFRPQRMSVEQLVAGRQELARSLSSLTTTMVRSARTLNSTRSLFATMTAYHWTNGINSAIRKMPAPGVTGTDLAEAPVA